MTDITKEMIDITKSYRTRCGHRVEQLRREPLNARGEAVTFPIKGVIVTCEFPRRTQYAIWTNDGRYTVVERGDHKYDLLEVVAEVHDETIVRKPMTLPPEPLDELAEKPAQPPKSIVPGHYSAGSALSSNTVVTLPRVNTAGVLKGVVAQSNSCETCGRNGDGCPAGDCCYAYGDTDLWEPKKGPLDVAADAHAKANPVPANTYVTELEDSYLEAYSQLHSALRWGDLSMVESVVAEMKTFLQRHSESAPR